ncbi:MAG: phosphatase PAP2 family protein [Calditrichaeota bacterium]|nr:MAG: phosphatase PAP2 family protein [Calditrichota bacterium]
MLQPLVGIGVFDHSTRGRNLNGVGESGARLQGETQVLVNGQSSTIVARMVRVLLIAALIVSPSIMASAHAQESKNAPRSFEPSTTLVWIAAASTIAVSSVADRKTQKRWPGNNAFTQIGNWWGLTAPFVIAGLRYPDNPSAAWRYLESGALSALSAGILKISIGRARPEAGLGPHHFRPGSFSSTWQSFPSGHTSFAAAAAGAALADQGAPLWIKGFAGALALTTAFARVAKGRHWLSDTVAGLWLGGAIGWHTMKRPGWWWFQCDRKQCALLVSGSY